MKKVLAFLSLLMLLVSIFSPALAKSKQMEADVPVWTEETVRQYALDYIEGKSMERLWGYYDLQIRRYMPLVSYKSILADMEFMTGKFISLGSYRTFEEEKLQLKTHVLHLCMEKLDLDMYFTTKNKDNDWEVMALEFVPAEREESEMALLVDDNPFVAPAKYTSSELTVGADASYPLNAILTLPEDASAEQPVPGVVLVHDDGPYDMNLSAGQVALFEDFADLFGDMGIAVLRYDKRTYTYPDAPIETVEDEVIQDAISAARTLAQAEGVDRENIFVLGVGFGGHLAGRIAEESDGLFAGIIIINGYVMSKLEYDYDHLESTIDSDDVARYKDAVKNMRNWKQSKASEQTFFDHNGYYYWDMIRFKQTDSIKSMKIPTLVVSSRNDTVVSKDESLAAYQNGLGKSNKKVTFMEVRNINHFLMADLSLNEYDLPEYDYPLHLEKVTGQDIANWILTQSSK